MSVAVTHEYLDKEARKLADEQTLQEISGDQQKLVELPTIELPDPEPPREN